MPVKGCKDLYASLDEYVKEEILDGENQYHSDRYGKQDAKKGVLFKSLPPVLGLHLRRFEYDFQTDAMAKINERFEFPTTLDLDRDGRALHRRRHVDHQCVPLTRCSSTAAAPTAATTTPSSVRWARTIGSASTTSA